MRVKVKVKVKIRVKVKVRVRVYHRETFVFLFRPDGPPATYHPDKSALRYGQGSR